MNTVFPLHVALHVGKTAADFTTGKGREGGGSETLISVLYHSSSLGFMFYAMTTPPPTA